MAEEAKDVTETGDLGRAEEAAAREATELAAAGRDDESGTDSRAKGAKGRPGTAAVGARKGASGSTNPGATGGDVRGESIVMTQGGIQTANATSVEVRQGGIGRANAQDVAVTMGGIGFARGDRVSVELGGMGAGIGREVRLTQGAASLLVGRDVNVEQSLVQTVAAANVRFERPSIVIFMLARRVEGPVRALFDWRAGLAFGAAAGIVASLFRLRR